MPWNDSINKKKSIDITNNVYKYESPFPNYDKLSDKIINRKIYDNDVLKINLDENKEGLTHIITKYQEIWDPSNKYEETKYTKNINYNHSYPEYDAFITYCMVRHYKPKKIIEIGCGFSTRIILQAIKDEKLNTKIYCIEPFVSDNIKQIENEIFWVKKPLEEMNLSVFQNLCENDICFIDSSHVLKPFGDVELEYINIIPSLKKGVLIHVHDIFYPENYPRQWLIDWKCVLTEQPLLVMYLTNNEKIKILSANNYNIINNINVPNNIENKCGGSFWFTHM